MLLWSQTLQPQSNFWKFPFYNKSTENRKFWARSCAWKSQENFYFFASEQAAIWSKNLWKWRTSSNMKVWILNGHERYLLQEQIVCWGLTIACIKYSHRFVKGSQTGVWCPPLNGLVLNDLETKHINFTDKYWKWLADAFFRQLKNEYPNLISLIS